MLREGYRGDTGLDIWARTLAVYALTTRGGQRLGISGRARGVPLLHLGLLLDGDVSQTTWVIKTASSSVYFCPVGASGSDPRRSECRSEPAALIGRGARQDVHPFEVAVMSER